MCTKIIVPVIAGLSLAGALPALAQEKAAMPLPPDIDPVSLTRLPQLTRADLDVLHEWIASGASLAGCE